MSQAAEGTDCSRIARKRRRRRVRFPHWLSLVLTGLLGPGFLIPSFVLVTAAFDYLFHAVDYFHAPWSMAVSCLDDLDPADAIPPLTPYFVMRIGRLPLVPYFRPGDPALAAAVGRQAAVSHALLLAQHGFIVGGRDLADAVANAEELEAAARLFFLLKDRPHRILAAEQIAELEDAFPRRI